MTNNTVPTTSFRDAVLFWFKLGFISFGGPAGQIATVHQELVENKRWISEKRFLHALNYCMLLPGPEALQLVIYMGWLLHRTIGGIIAGFLFVFPAILLLIFLSLIYVTFGQTPVIEGIFLGIKPAVTSIVIAAGYRISQRILKKTLHFALAFAAFGAMLIHAPFPVIIIGAGLIGFLAHRKNPALMETPSNTHGSSNKKLEHVPAIIDDDSMQLAHTYFSTKQILKVIFFSLLAWGIPFGLLMYYFGKSSVFTQLAWFFTKAALLTFGGAYAVLPYVFQETVGHFHWLTTAQMMDGLALGETTPGPLIIVVTFVGFVASFTHELLLNSKIWSGIFGGIVVSWFIFLPSFSLIFLGGPLIESTRQELRLLPILNGITCAVVGVIASLALFFALHTLFPENLVSGLFWQHMTLAATLMIASSFALIRYKQSILRIIFSCALIGLILFQIGLR
jgi:chromate transporter